MRALLIGAVAAMLCVGPALAAGDYMAGYYGNTVVSNGNGLESRTHFKADHTFDAVFSAGAQSLASKGTWTADAAGNICRTYDPLPPGLTNPVCLTDAAPHKPGDSWTVTVAGQARTVSMLAGIK
jgi:hypothetical protein